MQIIEFPSEIAVFANYLLKSQIKELEREISKNKAENFVPSLSDWTREVKSLVEKSNYSSSEILSLYSKLAWIQCDISFFAKYQNYLTDESPNILLQGYLGAGVAEFLDLEKGILLIQDAFELAKKNKDQEAILDLSTPFALILNNSGRNNQLSNLQKTLQHLFGEKIDLDPRINALLSPALFFEAAKGSRSINLDASESLNNAVKFNHNLNSALMHTFLSKEENSNSYENHQEAAIAHLKKIDAKNRIIIAYTNYASHYAMKMQNEASEKHFQNAISIAKDIEIKHQKITGLLLYPYSTWASIHKERGELHKAKELYRLTLKNAIGCNNQQYQSKAESGLALINYLQNNDDQALKHAINLKSIIDEIDSDERKASLLLHYIELMIDLKKTEAIPSLLESVDEKNLDPCSELYLKYLQGKFELDRFNIGNAKKYLEEGLAKTNKCSKMKTSLLFALSESNLHEYRLSENQNSLRKAESMVKRILTEISDIPNRSKGEFLLSIILCAQGRYEEAEEILEPFFHSSLSVPRFKNLAEKVLDDIRDQRVSSVSISPISNVRDVLRYLREAKDVIHSEPR
ncbi:MAG: hypothetical protein EAX86_00105 [Candidatus Heimdallarchaeota archaeon]|nr:hypothetical protein [Candidatus Heimdallarchaeota archaeon]